MWRAAEPEKGSEQGAGEGDQVVDGVATVPSTWSPVALTFSAMETRVTVPLSRPTVEGVRPA